MQLLRYSVEGRFESGQSLRQDGGEGHDAQLTTLGFAGHKDKLKRFGLFSQFGEDRFFATVGEAVSCYLISHSEDWVDWEDQAQPIAGLSAQPNG